MYLESAGIALILLARQTVKSSTACSKLEFSRLTLKQKSQGQDIRIFHYLSKESQSLTFLGHIASLAIDNLGCKK